MLVNIRRYEYCQQFPLWNHVAHVRMLAKLGLIACVGQVCKAGPVGCDNEDVLHELW